VNRDRFREEEEPLPVVWDSAPVVRADHECFADETAIDFPCVRPLVERQRDVFLGVSEPEMLKTEVLLSARDAARGTLLPLAVPLRTTCTQCGGRGELWLERCRSCWGSGEEPCQRRVLLSVPPGVPDGTRLRFRVKAPLTAPVRVEVRVAVKRSAA
jgi:hypothetical protein